MNRWIFLGTGASTGVPVIGCECPTCMSPSPFNQRLRPSGLVHIGGLSLLVDAGPDLRQQALRSGIGRLDGVLLTHTHFDHIAGIDELRIYNFYQKGPLPCLMSEKSYQELRSRYLYLLEPEDVNASLTARLDVRILSGMQGQIEFLGEKIGYFSYFQGPMPVTGYRIGDIAYVSDIKTYDETIFSWLAGVPILILSALRDGPARLMFSLEEAIAFAKKAGAQKTWLTHMNHEIEYSAASRRLPEGIQLAYDGLEIPFGT